MTKKSIEKHLGWIPPSGKRRVPIEVVAVYKKPSKEEELEIDKAIIGCVLGI